MSTFTPAPLSHKAVMVMQTEDGGVSVFTVYDPTNDVAYEDSFSDRATAKLSYREGMVVKTDPSSEEVQKIIQNVYTEARNEALIEETQKLSIMPSGDDMIALNFRTHEAAIQAVYQHGVARGAQLVQFEDAHTVKKIRRGVLNEAMTRFSRFVSEIENTEGSKHRPGRSEIARRARLIVSEMIKEDLS